jgi:hypothetical protein
MEWLSRVVGAMHPRDVRSGAYSGGRVQRLTGSHTKGVRLLAIFVNQEALRWLSRSLLAGSAINVEIEYE